MHAQPVLLVALNAYNTLIVLIVFKHILKIAPIYVKRVRITVLSVKVKLIV